MVMHVPIQAAELPDALLARGRYSAASAELRELTGLADDAFDQAMYRLRRAGKLVSPAKGFWVVVPAEYRSLGGPPPEWYVDGMLRHLDRGYYVSLLTAAAVHGARHQAAMSFQVVVDRHLPPRRVGRARFEFVTDAHIAQMEVVSSPTHTGGYQLATRETTVIDLVWQPRRSGGLGNVLTVLAEIGELDSERIATLASVRSTAVARRLGWLLERARPEVDLAPLLQVAHAVSSEPTSLSAGAPRRGIVDRTWLVRVNANVEADR